MLSDCCQSGQEVMRGTARSRLALWGALKTARGLIPQQATEENKNQFTDGLITKAD